MRGLLKGDKVILEALREEDLDVVNRWFNNVEFLRHYDMIPAVTQNKKEVSEMLEEFEKSNERYIFGIRLKEDHRLIGILGYDDIVWASGSAFLFIGIGEYDFHGKGLAKEALTLLLDFGFSELNLHKIQLNVLQYNERAIKLYEACGFVKEGTYREYIYRDSQRYDMYLYGILKTEWQQNARKNS
ncbi:GNAT family N-acetyltransferase [Clostridium sp. 19966]|uniref:GNAT family N-acetyltransferase n=1 Tax=Clostridium sp. 19966 TaxID=2768166 RepID=UPI0028DE6B6E|nr:GNAT family protein [Clostridium sp. 19966]MDT8717319.1 GNAT family N-acetyltransferase [Clostridium sp. 19966]